MPQYMFGPFELDSEARLLRREGEPVPLTGKTLDTLVVLVENRGRLVGKEELLSRVWAGSVVEEANLTQAIFTLRKTLGDSPKDHRYIATVAGRGYQFVAPATQSTLRVQAGGRKLEDRRPLSRRNRILQFAVAGIATASLGALIAFWMVRRPNQNPDQSAEIQRFTSYPGIETMPAFSPDGNQIAYVRAEHDPIGAHFWKRGVGQANLYTKLIGAATELRLTNHPGADYYPAWSPDGQYIAFYRWEPGASGFYVVSALGGQERRITKEEAETAGITWLADGRHLVVSHFFEGSHKSPLIEISLDTGEERPITSPSPRDFGDMWPAVSPDGKTLAFLRLDDSRAVAVCFALLPDGSAPLCRPLRASWPEGLTWTPTGDGIIVSAIPTGPRRLWVYSLNGRMLAALTSGEEDAALPTSSRQRYQLAYVSYRRNMNLSKLDVGLSLSANPADAKPVASSTRMQLDPALSPNGGKIAYLSNRTGGLEIWVTDMETQSSTQLTRIGGPPPGSPSWSPDGREVAFDSEHSGATDIFVISAEGGVPRRITTAPAENCVPSWSTDGKSIYFTSDRNGEFQIWKVPAATGETSSHPATQVTQGGGFRAFESNDGEYLYYAKGRGKPGLWRRNLLTGKEESVLDSLQEWGWWALAPKVIYFVEQPRSVHSEVHLKAFDIARRRVRELGTLPYPVVNASASITVSSDGQHLVYTQVDSLEADIMLMSHVR